MLRGYPSLAKRAGLKIRCRRTPWVRIPPLAFDLRNAHGLVSRGEGYHSSGYAPGNSAAPCTLTTLQNKFR